MKGFSAGLLTILPLLAAGRIFAEEDLTPPGLRLERASIDLDIDADSPDGADLAESTLEAHFKVNHALIKKLRQKKLSYGEISIVLSIARNLPKGISRAGVNKIMRLRQGPPVQHWGTIAEKLGVDARTVLQGVRSMDRDLRRAERLEIPDGT